MNNLKYLKMEVTLRAKENIIIPEFHGSMLRGVIGQTLRKVSCTSKESECTDCLYVSACPYTSIFFCIDKGEGLLKKIETVPNPFVIFSPMDGTHEITEGSPFVFYITIFGKAITYLHYFIHSLYEIENLGIGVRRGKLVLETVRNVDTGELIVNGRNLNVNHLNASIFKPAYKNTNAVTIEFDTPLRIKDQGALTQNISFHLFMRTILRRLALIYDYHMDEPFESDYLNLLEEAKQVKVAAVNLRWKKLSRYSSRAQRKLSIGGSIGRITYKGDLTKFMPYIYAGQLLHIGKGCTLGLGHYNVLT